MTVLPAIYKNVLPIGGGSPNADGAPTAKCGGLFAQPDLGLAYLMAAHFVIEGGSTNRSQNEVGLPSAYLQRHAFELAIKHVTDRAYVYQADSGYLEHLRGKGPDTGAPKTALTSHELPQIVEILRALLLNIGHGELPVDIIEMSDHLTEVEARCPERLRYPSIRDLARGKGAFKTSFPEAVVLHIGETQAALVKFFSDHFVYERDSGNLVTELADAEGGLSQTIAREFGMEYL